METENTPEDAAAFRDFVMSEDPEIVVLRSFISKTRSRGESIAKIVERRPDITLPFIQECIAKIEGHGGNFHEKASELYCKLLQIAQEAHDEAVFDDDFKAMWGGDLRGRCLEKYGRIIPEGIPHERRLMIAVALHSQSYYFAEAIRDQSYLAAALVSKFGENYQEAFLEQWARVLADSPLFVALSVQPMTAPIGMFVFRKKSELTGNWLRQTDTLSARPYGLGGDEGPEPDLQDMLASVHDMAARQAFGSIEATSKEVCVFDVGRALTLAFGVAQASAAITRRAGFGKAGWILTNPKNIALFPEDELKLSRPIITDSKPEVRLIGELTGDYAEELAGVRVIVDPAFPYDKMLVGRQAENEFDVDTVWAPYCIPLRVRLEPTEHSAIGARRGAINDEARRAIRAGEIDEAEFHRRVGDAEAEERAEEAALVAAGRFTVAARLRAGNKLVDSSGYATVKIERK